MLKLYRESLHLSVTGNTPPRLHLFGRVLGGGGLLTSMPSGCEYYCVGKCNNKFSRKSKQNAISSNQFFLKKKSVKVGYFV